MVDPDRSAIVSATKHSRRGTPNVKEKEKKEYTNCLRLSICPDELESERIEGIKNYCLKYGFKNMILFINSEVFFVGHMTREDAEPWIETIKRAKRIFNQNGISVSLNPWIEMGHAARGRKLKPGQNFTTMVDMYGTRSLSVACPLCENWREYFADIYSYFLESVEPEVVWIEDDFRLHNHGTELKYGGCFCEKHIAALNKMLGTNYTRDEIREKIFESEPTKERLAWLELSRNTMTELAGFIGQIVFKASPKTRIGLMSARPDVHCTEARDWKGICSALAPDGKSIHRIHLPCYRERPAQEYYYDFNAVSVGVRSLLPGDAEIFPEIEYGEFSSFFKDGRFMRFQIESAIPLCVLGMTYDIFDFTGNGAIEAFGLGQHVKEILPYMQAVTSLDIEFSSRVGVIVPVDELSCRNRRTNGTWQGMTPDSFNPAGYLNALGVTCRIDTAKSYKNQTVVLFGETVNDFTDDELKALFADNFVIADGGAVLQLLRRGLKNLINAESAEVLQADIGLHTYEQAREEIAGIRNYRAATQYWLGDYVKIRYEKEPEVLSDLYNQERKFVGIGVTKTAKTLIIPFIYNDFLRQTDAFNLMRREILLKAIKGTAGQRVVTDRTGLCPFLYLGEKKVLMLVNTTLSDLEEVSFSCTVPFKRLTAVERDGSLKEIPFKRSGDSVTVKSKLPYLTTTTIILSDK